MRVYVQFAPTIPSPEGPKHEGVLYENAEGVEFPNGDEKTGILTIKNGEGRYVKLNWLHIRDVQVDEYATVRVTPPVPGN